MKTVVLTIITAFALYGAEPVKEKEKKAPVLTAEQKIIAWQAFAKERDAEAAYLALDAQAQQTKEARAAAVAKDRAAEANTTLQTALKMCGEGWLVQEDPKTHDLLCIEAQHPPVAPEAAKK